MPPSLTIAVAQPPTLPHDVEANALAHADAVRLARCRVVAFPEMSLTGYEFDADPIDPADARLNPLIDACRATGARALAGAPVAGDGAGKSIGVIAVDGHGASVAYRKMWLGSDEQTAFVRGRHPTAIDVDGWRLGLAICKDTGEAAHSSATAALGIDVYVAGVLEHQRDAEVQPTRARRIAADHGVWVAIASFAGSTGEGFTTAAGGSAIWRPDGTPAALAGPDPGEVVTHELKGA